MLRETKGARRYNDTVTLMRSDASVDEYGHMKLSDPVKVLVCHAYVRQMSLAKTMMTIVKRGMMSSLMGKIGGLLAKPSLKRTLKTFDASEHGGAPLLGLKGLVVKIHGSSTAKETRNAIMQCVSFKEARINERIMEYLAPAQDAGQIAE